eukprot:2561031-Pleurochrysis_carterae.AAC.1
MYKSAARARNQLKSHDGPQRVRYAQLVVVGTHGRRAVGCHISQYAPCTIYCLFYFYLLSLTGSIPRRLRFNAYRLGMSGFGHLLAYRGCSKEMRLAEPCAPSTLAQRHRLFTPATAIM